MLLEILFSIYLMYSGEMHSSSKAPKNLKDSTFSILPLFINNFSRKSGILSALPCF